jgi:hypothetical protein
MMLYDYICEDCEIAYSSPTFQKIGDLLDGARCAECNGNLVRAVSLFNATPVSCSQPYFNYAVGDYVTSTSDFEHKLREGAKRQSERLGYDQNYVPVYPAEKKAWDHKYASNDTKNGETVEYYRRRSNLVNDKRTIIT